jgi:hypothetical protein
VAEHRFPVKPQENWQFSIGEQLYTPVLESCDQSGRRSFAIFSREFVRIIQIDRNAVATGISPTGPIRKKREACPPEVAGIELAEYAARTVPSSTCRGTLFYGLRLTCGDEPRFPRAFSWSPNRKLSEGS